MTRARKKKKVDEKKRSPATSQLPEPKPTESEVSRFDNLKNLAYGGIIAVGLFTMSVNGFAEMWTVPQTRDAMSLFACRIVLFIELVILAFRWVIATHNEFNLWLRWLDNPIQKQEVYGALFALSVVLGLCVSFPHRIVFITAFMSVSLLLNYWTQWLSNDHFSRALAKTRESLMRDDARSRVLAVMEHYWLRRPQLARIVTVMFFSLVAFSSALAGAVQREPAKTTYQVLAYTILITAILLSETVIGVWRYQRDRDIRKLESE